jgi:methylated-DNA-protein-cysteine methyltransferase-like protein
MASSEPGINHKVWQVVTAIPTGKVTTYGEVAKKAGMTGAARRVGSALRGLPPDTRIPWHRVVNAQGRISFPAGSEAHNAQRERLESEGVCFRVNGAIDLGWYGW